MSKTYSCGIYFANGAAIFKLFDKIDMIVIMTSPA